MSKYLGLLFIIASANLLAQDAIIEPEVCNTGESCVETTTAGGHQSVFKLIQIENEEGEIVGSKLNVASSITDIFYEGISSCHKGKVADICNIGELMAGNTNLEYTQGGHAQILNFECYSLNNTVTYDYDVKSDYEPEVIPTSVEIKICE